MASPAVTDDDLKSALPDTSSAVALRGLNDAVEVLRDTYGIPHVKAGSVHDAFFGQGYATAQDRLWHMDYDRRRAYGRWAEYAGEVALEQDLMMRRFQLAASARRDYGALNGETVALLDAYTAGVNAFIDTTDSLPVEYALVRSRPERWEPWDCLAVFKVRHILMGGYEAKLWRARMVNVLGPEKTAELCRGYQRGHLLIVPPGVDYDGPFADGLKAFSDAAQDIGWLAETDSGSNSWALAGSRTASGKPLVAGDPHRPLDTPNVYYQNHIACPEFDAIGLSFPGFPAFPHFGHNENVAWCVTHAGADYQDLYLERFDEGNPARYEFQGSWLEADVRHEIIKVRGGKDVEIDALVTQHGPIVAGDPAGGHAVAFKYTATSGTNRFSEAILPMLRSTSADELDESMRPWVDPCNNFVFADVHGNIGYLNRGRVPIRSMANAWLPVPGWTGQHEWDGDIPFEELARIRNPDTGLIVTANNRIVGQDYPYHISLDYAPEHRARRILGRLSDLRNATVEDMASVHSEKVSIPAQTYSRLLSQIAPIDDRSAMAKEVLDSWDGSMDRDSVAPTIYSAFRLKLNRELLEYHLGPLAEEALAAGGRGAPSHLRQLEALFVTLARENDLGLLPGGNDWSGVLAHALSDGVAWLAEWLGEDIDAWRWGRVHATSPRHTLSESFPDLGAVLDPPSVPMGGDGDTPQAGSYASSEPFTMTGLSVARYVFDTSDWDSSAWVVPLGASGHPGSPHYADQTPEWSDLKLVPMLYSWERLAAAAESSQTLTPGS